MPKNVKTGILALLLTLAGCAALFAATNKTYLKISASTSGVAVAVNGTIVGFAPITVEVPTGNFRVSGTKVGYKEAVSTGWIASGTVNVYLSMVPLPTTGDLTVKVSNTTGVSIYVDGSYKGIAPVTVRNLSPGTHTVRTYKYGFEDKSTSVYIAAGDDKTLTTALDMAELVVTANVVGASVYLDGSYKGTTPLTIREVEPGSHTIELTKTHYAKVTDSVTLKSGYRTSRSFEMTKISGYLNISTTPSNAAVSCDGVAIGKSNVEIDEGTHTLRLRCFGYDDLTDSVYITRNKTTNVSKTMQRATFAIRSLTTNNESFNPNIKGKRSTVKLSWYVTAPEDGTLTVTNASGYTVASWTVKFSTWEGTVEWDGKQRGTAVADGVYTVKLDAGGISRTLSVTVDSTIRQSYGRRGIYGSIGNFNGAYHDGVDININGSWGGNHFFMGVDLDISTCDLKDDYVAYDDNGSITFINTDFFVGYSWNVWKLRPYLAGGLGFYVAMPEGDGDNVAGAALEGIFGLDVLFGNFAIGGVYRLKTLTGSGFVDNFGVTAGWSY